MQAWVIGNWKQNPATNLEVSTLVDGLLTAVSSDPYLSNNEQQHCQLMVAPSCIHLAAVSARLANSPILSASQDIGAHGAQTGAYTGDCSAAQVADAGASWTILGHSERRQYHQEDAKVLAQKIQHALSQSIGVILCIGETQVQYNAQQTFAALDAQLTVIDTVLKTNPDMADTLSQRLIIAYEPVWAIGTGKVPTVTEVSKTHQHIKQTLAKFDERLHATPVVYGGSVNTDNADSFAADPMISGALVGGASLKATSFLAIAQAFVRAKTPA